MTTDQWVSFKDRMPEIGQQVLLAASDRLMAFDPLGCAKDVGVLCDSGNGLYWSTHGERRAMCSDAYTHWMPITEPSHD
jgi:hypothetical protein